MRSLFITGFAALVLSWCASAHADFADDLARIHMESIGGKQSLLELKSLRASGVTKIEGESLHFVMWAARPNLVRTETTSKGRVVTQGFDGVNPPWMMDSKVNKVREMGAIAARAFSADADFDDPLVLRGRRPIAVDYAGETEVDGVAVFKLLVTENLTETSFLYLDHSTYFIIRRDVVKPGAKGPETIETHYADFSPVGGVMLPHRIIEKADGVLRYETVLETSRRIPRSCRGCLPSR